MVGCSAGVEGSIPNRLVAGIFGRSGSGKPGSMRGSRWAAAGEGHATMLDASGRHAAFGSLQMVHSEAMVLVKLSAMSEEAKNMTRFRTWTEACTLDTLQHCRA